MTNLVNVLKFGGGSVYNADSVKQEIHIIKQFNKSKLLIVNSAFGKTTNALEELTKSYFKKRKNVNQILNGIKNYHFIILSELFSDNDPIFNTLSQTFNELEKILYSKPKGEFDFIYDQIVCFGELISTKIVHAYLIKNKIKTCWIDARNFIKTDTTYREGRINWEATSNLIHTSIPKILKSNNIITQGYIGSTNKNYTTTLGREGSDFTASIFASILKAKSLTIWKDVEGILNADPKEFPDTVKYNQLPYSETIEMSYYGASVLHPKTIKPLQNNKIPLFVKPFMTPNASGTLINDQERIYYKIPVTIVKKNQVLISISPKDLSFIQEDHLSEIFTLLTKYKIKINVMQNSAISFSICVDNNPVKVNPFLKELKNDYHLIKNENTQLITIRHYNEIAVNELTNNKKIFLEQKSRGTVQFVVK